MTGRRWGALGGLVALLLLLVVPAVLVPTAARAATPPPSVSISDAWVVEPAAGATTTATFFVRLSQLATGSESVHWATTAGTAAADDFSADSGVVTWTAGSSEQQVTVTVTGDNRLEPNETFGVTLSTPVGVGIGDTSATGTIASDEGPRQIAVTDASVLEGPAGTTRSAVFTITASSPVLSGETVSVRFATANGSAIGGTDYNGRSGILTIPPDTSQATISVTVRGDATVEPSESFGLNLSAPTGAVLADPSATGVIRNDDGSTAAAPLVGLSVDDGWAVEADAGGTSSVDFRLSLPVATSRPVSVQYATAGGTANSADFVSRSGTATVPAGQTTTSVVVPVTPDDVAEGNETFRLTLSAPSGAVLADASGMGTIADDEGPLTATVGNASVVEGANGQVNLSFAVDLSSSVAAGQTVSVRYATANGTATAGSDYLGKSGTLSFGQESHGGMVQVPVLGDATAEPDETLTLTLSSPVGLVLADPTGTGTVLNDDAATVTPVSAALAGGSASEAGTAPASVTVAFAKPLPSSVDLTFSTGGGTATPDIDYVPATNQPISVAAGATQANLPVTILDDGDPEPTETVFVSVSAPAGVVLEGPSAMLAILDDEEPLPAVTTTAVAVGDIACSPTDPNFHAGVGTEIACGQMATSQVAVNLHPDAVLGLGDLQYENGEFNNFQQSYNLSWGRLRAVTRPAPGNHEYYTAGAAGYFQYFLYTVGTDTRPVERWYAFDLGNWRVLALNSNCSSIGGCGVGSPEETWLRDELAAHPSKCTVAYWHHPRFSTGAHGDDPTFDTFWRDLSAAGVDLVLNGHDHTYERFAPMNVFGGASPTGMRQFVSGLGGKNIYSFSPTPRPTSEVRSATRFGVLALTLRPDGYDWHEMPVAGQTVPNDTGSTDCH